MTSSMIVHIAGLDVTIDGEHQRQRCAWCGAVIIEYTLSRIAVPIGQPGPPAVWPVGALVAVDGGMSYVVESEKLPPESCSRIDFAVTR